MDKPIRFARLWGGPIVRVAGIVFVILGGLILGYQGVVNAARAPVVAVGAAETNPGRDTILWIPPVVAWIVMVVGLLLIALSGRRE